MSCGPSCRAVHHVVRSITSCGPSRRAVHHVVRAVTWWGHHVVRSSRAANTSAARRQVCVECADRVSRKEAKAQRVRGIGTDLLCGGACCGALRCSAVLPGREHERSEASGARGMRGQSLTQRRKSQRVRGIDTDITCGGPHGFFPIIDRKAIESKRVPLSV